MHNVGGAGRDLVIVERHKDVLTVSPIDAPPFTIEHIGIDEIGPRIDPAFSVHTATASDQAVSVAAATAKNGLSGIWFQWMWLFSTPFYWLIAPIMRRFRAVTTADIYELRYDRSVSMLFAVVGIASHQTTVAFTLKKQP